MLTEGLNLDNIFGTTRVIGTVMRRETFKKTESCETKTEIALQYEKCLGGNVYFPSDIDGL